MTQGIDLSKWNANVNWPVAKGYGIFFAFMKATQGLTYIDPTVNRRWAECGANGVIRGVYHFLERGNPVAQAQHFFNQVGPLHPGDLFPAMDWEPYTNDGGRTYIRASAEDALAFLNECKKLMGVKPFVYGPSSYLDLDCGPEFTEYPLWLAQYASHPHTPKAWAVPGWTIWQTSGTAFVPGVGRPGIDRVDTDLFKGSLDDLKALVKVSNLSVPVKSTKSK